jgi:hypothetical protein
MPSRSKIETFKFVTTVFGPRNLARIRRLVLVRGTVPFPTASFRILSFDEEVWHPLRSLPANVTNLRLIVVRWDTYASPDDWYSWHNPLESFLSYIDQHLVKNLVVQVGDLSGSEEVHKFVLQSVEKHLMKTRWEMVGMARVTLTPQTHQSSKIC